MGASNQSMRSRISLPATVVNLVIESIEIEINGSSYQYHKRYHDIYCMGWRNTNFG